MAESQPPVRDDLARNPWRRWLVNAFILWHLFALTIWLLPQSDLRQDCLEIVKPYMTYTGLMQSWTMFSPNPAGVDYWVEARITYANGLVRYWHYPRMVEMGLIKRYEQERWRKFIEIAEVDENKMVWPSLARYPARVKNIYPNNPPVGVDLIRHWRYVPAPGQSFGPYQTYTFYSTRITDQDLR